jgi:drug/metabolite transporter (DMT)-like permease
MIVFATVFLDESVTFFTIVIAVIVVFSVIIGKNAPVEKKDLSGKS